MRSSRLFAVLLLFLGLALLWQGLQWYDGYLARKSAYRGVPASARRPVRARPPRAVPTPAPTPTPRAISTCLRAPTPAQDEITAAIEALAKYDAVWPDSVGDAECLVEALAARAGEDPERIRDALIPYAFSLPARLRGPALDGLRKVPLREISPALRKASEGAVSASFPVRAALALGLDEESAPHLVEEWLNSPEPSAQGAIREHLRRSPKRAAAVFIANALALDPGNATLVGLARARDAQAHDVSDALAELALDELRSLGERQAALEALGTTGDPAVAPRLEPLRGAADPTLRAYAEAALAALRSGRRRR